MDLARLFGQQACVGLGLNGEVSAMAQPALSLFRGDEADAEDGVTFEAAVERYCQAAKLSERTRQEYRTTVRRLQAWQILHRWSTPMRLSDLDRQKLTDFLEWVFAQAVEAGDANPGRTVNKRRDHLHAVLTWSIDQDLLDALPRFPPKHEQKEAAGLFYFHDDELDRLYWATYSMPRPHGWTLEYPVGSYWRAALVIWLVYGVDTQTVFAYDPAALPLRWGDVFWESTAPDRLVRETNEWGWIYYRRKKTGRSFMRPMTREVHLHLRAIQPKSSTSENPVFASAGGSRPCERFQELVGLARLDPKRDFESRQEYHWTVKDLRKTCATRYEQHLPGSASAILGHALGGDGDGRARVTYKHYANTSPMEIRAITTCPPFPASRAIWDESVKPTAGLLFAK